MDDLLADVLSHLQSIRASRKGSIGSLNNVYLPQLDVGRVDKLVERVRVLMSRQVSTRTAGLHQGVVETSSDSYVPMELVDSAPP